MIKHSPQNTKENSNLLNEIKNLIEQSRQEIAISVNTTLSMLYWNIGNRINKEILLEARAEYGKRIIFSLAQELQFQYGSSFSEKNIRRMMQFAQVFPEKEIVVSLIRKLSWTHILVLIPIDDSLKREFYIEMCKMEKWSARTFQEKR